MSERGRPGGLGSSQCCLESRGATTGKLLFSLSCRLGQLRIPFRWSVRVAPVGRFQWKEPVAESSLIAAIVRHARFPGCVEIAAGLGPLRVDGAGNLGADLSPKGDAAGGLIVCSFHVHPEWRHRLGKLNRDAVRIGLRRVSPVEGDAKAGAAGAACQAGMGVLRHRPKAAPWRGTVPPTIICTLWNPRVISHSGSAITTVLPKVSCSGIWTRHCRTNPSFRGRAKAV